MTALSARLEQNGELIALALASFGRSRESVEFHELHMPEVANPESLPARDPTGGPALPMHERFEMRPAFGAVGPGTSLARDQRWLAAPGRADRSRCAGAGALQRRLAARDLAAPLDRRRVRCAACRPIDLTVHFRGAIPANARPDDHYLCLFRSHIARDGYVEEDGEIWTRDGILLVQSRQLALLV